jgi:hypothetical protein
MCGQHYGQLSGRASNHAYRDFFLICASSPNRPQITQNAVILEKRNLPFVRSTGCWPVVSGDLPENMQTKVIQIARSISASCRDEQAGSLCSPEANALCAAHVCAGTRVDLDRFAFLNEKRHVDRLASFEFCRLGDVTGGIAAKAFC